MGDSTGGALERAAEALGDPDRLFTLEQVQFFRAAAQAYGYELRRREERVPDALSYEAGYQAGYRQRCAEENAARPSPRVFDRAAIEGFGRVLGERAAARADRAQRWPGAGDNREAARERALAEFMWGDEA